MNTTTRFFQTKEQHKAFRIAFAAGQNDKRAHKSFTTDHPYFDDKPEEKKAMRRKVSGWMTSAHFLLFNLVCGRDFYSGFSPKTKTLFLQSGGNPDRGLNGAIEYLTSLVNTARGLLNQETLNVPSWIKDKKKWIADQQAKSQNTINTFLEPLGGVFTLADLARLQLPTVVQSSRSPAEYEEMKKAGKAITYRELLGEQVIDQTLPSAPVAAVLGMAQLTDTYTLAADTDQPKKKTILGRIFS